MKKKISGVIIIVAVAAAAIWNFNQSKNEVTLSEYALANIEALARGENSGNGAMNQMYECKKCNIEFEGCFHCTEDPNNCNCTAPGHSH